MQGDIRLSILVPPELRDRLHIAAKACRTNISRLVEKIILEYLETGREEGK